MRKMIRRVVAFAAAFALAASETLQRRIELYLLGIGITPEEISTFKEIMLEK